MHLFIILINSSFATAVTEIVSQTSDIYNFWSPAFRIVSWYKNSACVRWRAKEQVNYILSASFSAVPIISLSWAATLRDMMWFPRASGIEAHSVLALGLVMTWSRDRAPQQRIITSATHSPRVAIANLQSNRMILMLDTMMCQALIRCGPYTVGSLDHIKSKYDKRNFHEMIALRNRVIILHRKCKAANFFEVPPAQI